MNDDSDTVIYVGKARNLKKRIASYFSSSQITVKTKLLVSKISQIRFIVTKTEKEAFILEDSYIKQFKPKYNIRLKDDKRYPYIGIDLNEKFPRLKIFRRNYSSSVKCFGPFPSNAAAHKIIKILNDTFKLRRCSLLKMNNKPCLYYQIHKCSGCCAGYISETEYSEIIKHIIKILSGNPKELISEIELKMKNAALNKKFEDAAEYRDNLFALKELLGEQIIDTANLDNFDVIGYAVLKSEFTGEYTGCIQKFCYRSGRMVFNESKFFELPENFDSSIDDNNEFANEILSRYIFSSYSESLYIPQEIILQNNFADIENVQNNISEKRGSRVMFTVPQIGRKKKLIEFIIKNCEQILKQNDIKLKINSRKLVETAEILQLDKIPEYIYCFDISNISGTNAVGSAVLFKNGMPFKKGYRKYRIKTVEGIDEYAMMRELLERHFTNVINNSNGTVWPDLTVIDGGIQHLNVAIDIIRNKLSIEWDKFKIIAIAKKEEIIYMENSDKPVILEKNSSVLRMIQHLRDETHRFGITYHRILRHKQADLSALDSIPGIGPKKKEELLKYFKSIDNIKFASVEEIAGVKYIDSKLATNIKKYLSQ